MAIRVPSTQDLYSWLGKQSGRYVVLRDEYKNGDLTELNLLMDDRLALAFRQQFPHQKRGVKIDVYDVNGRAQSHYHGYSHLPEQLGERLLETRITEAGRYVAHPQEQLFALLYHAAYHKPVQSDIPFRSSCSGLHRGPYSDAIERAAKACGQAIPTDLLSMHEQLEQAGYGIKKDRLIAYLQHDFRYLRKSYFHAWLMNQYPGELNLFVIRSVAQKFGRSDDLIKKLRDHYEVLLVKPVSWQARFTKMKHMRGGKWKRGGKPHYAVVVFDSHPIPTNEAQQKVHPFVFNARQFIKQQWRQWFSETTGARAKDNPIHSTDNEAEAIGHLPLFFSSVEQTQILQQLNTRRETI